MEGEVSGVDRPAWMGLPRRRAGGFILRERDGTLEVLLMRRYRVERGEYFVIPGGSVEDGEDVAEAAVRELREETSLEFKLETLLYQSLNPRSGRVGHYFLARWTDGQPELGGPERERAKPGQHLPARLGASRDGRAPAALPQCDPRTPRARCA